MARRSRMILAGLGLAVLLGGALSGCASTAGTGGTEGAKLEAAWLDDGRMIGIVTMGSSTCVPIAEEPTLNGSVLEVTLVEPDESTACTRDLVTRATPVGVPEGVDPAKDLEISVSGEGYAGTTELEGVSGLGGPGGETDYLPSAGWTDVDGEFVFLSWGSSTCVPVIEAVAASGPAEVTMIFKTPDDAQVCTMDMAPRTQVAFVDGLEEDENVQAVLEGAEFDNISIPIYGEN